MAEETTTELEEEDPVTTEGGDGGSGFDPTELVAQIVEQVGEQTSSLIDRRINGLMKTLRDDYGLKKDAPKSPEQPTNQFDDRILKRLRKAAVAEAIGLASFPDEETRAVARRKALRLADSLPVDPNEDDYSFAEGVVKEVSDELTALRTLYEEQTRADLKRRGLLSDESEESSGGQPPKKPGKSGPDPEKEFKTGAAKAAAMFAPAPKEGVGE